jgi:3-dehydroquinate synthase
LLAIVDASVGVKNGVDFLGFKNRIGSFYAPHSVYIDLKFLSTVNERNIINGMGEILKLALVRSKTLFLMLEKYGKELVQTKFNISQGEDIINKSIQIMLEELGPNLWEQKLERCVDFGHTFSKIIEMIPNINIMHGEAVNLDGYLCAKVSRDRGYISQSDFDRIGIVMKNIGLPTQIPEQAIAILPTALQDAVEHRNGKQRIPLLDGIGSYIIVNDITCKELSC